MTVHSFEERLEDASSHLQGLEEKARQGLAASMHWLLHVTCVWRMGKRSHAAKATALAPLRDVNLAL